MTKIGYIGLGALGGALARRFLPDHSLMVWDIDAAAVATLQQLGAAAAASAADLARECDVILTCLPRSSDVRQLIFGPGGLAGGLSAGKLVIDQTSGDPTESQEIAARLDDRGVQMIDAAVSASPQVVATGDAMLMMSGTDEACARALPILHAMSGNVFRCGSRVGDGQAMKMINNAMNAGCRLGTLEIAALGIKSGLSLDSMNAVLDRGLARNLTTDRMLPAIAAGRASTNFALSLMLKDQSQAVSLGMGLGIPMPICNLVRALLQIGVNQLGPGARLEDIVGLIESMAATRFAQSTKAALPSPLAAETIKSTVGYVGSGTLEGAAIPMDSLRSLAPLVCGIAPGMRKALEAAGAVGTEDLKWLARASDVVVLDLPDLAAMDDALFGSGGLADALAPGKVVVAFAPCDPIEIHGVAAKLRSLDVALIDAAICEPGLAEGAIACGGDSRAFTTARPVLEALSASVVYCGESGNGNIAAALHGGATALGYMVAYECLSAGLKYGLRVDDMAAILDKSSGWSAASRKILPNLAAGRNARGPLLGKVIDALELSGRLAISRGAPIMILGEVRSLLETAMNALDPNLGIEQVSRFYAPVAELIASGAD